VRLVALGEAKGRTFTSVTEFSILAE